jgi:hypothetical protein
MQNFYVNLRGKLINGLDIGILTWNKFNIKVGLLKDKF